MFPKHTQNTFCNNNNKNTFYPLKKGSCCCCNEMVFLVCLFNSCVCMCVFAHVPILYTTTHHIMFQDAFSFCLPQESENQTSSLFCLAYLHDKSNNAPVVRCLVPSGILVRDPLQKPISVCQSVNSFNKKAFNFGCSRAFAQ